MSGQHLGNRQVQAGSLTERQREVYTVIQKYYAVMGEPCPERLLARRLGRHWTTVRGHVQALERKGWLRRGGIPLQIDG